jgi:hypothetical protein
MSHGLSARPRDRRRIVQLFTARLQTELQTEVEAAQAIRERFQQSVIALEHALQDGAPWSEFMQMALDQLVALPGLKAAGLGAPDANGEFVVELSSGLEPSRAPCRSTTAPSKCQNFKARTLKASAHGNSMADRADQHHGQLRA